ncbi:MAG: filamentous hemagglutinin N-terminal domain-containing protein [Verrucomicrobiota bacterium]
MKSHFFPVVFALAVIAIMGGDFARANPTGEVVQHGDVTFQRFGNELRVLQSTNNAIINWSSFSIAEDETTRFQQPNSGATLNRVTGTAASVIDGQLLANGRVLLLNPNGILIGPTGRIDVGGFLASTLDVSDGEFLSGGDMVLRGDSTAAVVNLGSISALDGDVFLVARTVRNAGTIDATGRVGLAGGSEVLIKADGEERVFVRAGNGGSVSNEGAIQSAVAELKAHSGNVYGMAVRNEGRVAATTVTRSGGQIFLSAGGRGSVRSTGTLRASRSSGSDGGEVRVQSSAQAETEVGGIVDVSGKTGKGGGVAILGGLVEVVPDTVILADGDSGGGAIQIGGGREGLDAALLNAEFTTIGEGVRVSADARVAGDGGEVIFFAESGLTYDGFASVRGGSESGDGGFVELSGKQWVDFNGFMSAADLRAPQGEAGSLLFDPVNIIIADIPGGGSISDPFQPDGSNVVISDQDVSDFLQVNGSLELRTDGDGPDAGDITLQAGASITSSSAGSLTFAADRNIIVEGDATPENASFISIGGSFSGNARGSIVVGENARIFSSGGMISLANLGNSPDQDLGIGIEIGSGATLRTLDGDISIMAQGATVTGPYTEAVGLRIGRAIGFSNVQTDNGFIQISGRGGGISSNDHGIHLTGGASIRSRPTGVGFGDINVSGEGGLIGGDGVRSSATTSGGTSFFNSISATPQSGIGPGDGSTTLVEVFGRDSSISSLPAGGGIIHDGISLAVFSDQGEVFVDGRSGSAIAIDRVLARSVGGSIEFRAVSGGMADAIALDADTNIAAPHAIEARTFRILADGGSVTNATNGSVRAESIFLEQLFTDEATDFNLGANVDAETLVAVETGSITLTDINSITLGEPSSSGTGVDSFFSLVADIDSSYGTLPFLVDGDLSVTAVDTIEVKGPISVSNGFDPGEGNVNLMASRIVIKEEIEAEGAVELNHNATSLTVEVEAPIRGTSVTFNGSAFSDRFYIADEITPDAVVTGGGGIDSLNFSDSSFGPIKVDLDSRRANQVSFDSIERIVGSDSEDTIVGTSGDDIFRVIGPNRGNVGGIAFESFEKLEGGPGSDQFQFLGRGTVESVDGGSGFDILTINDSGLPGDHVYNISEGFVQRNPTYSFSDIELLELLLGPGAQTVNTGNFSFAQSLDGGFGFDSLFVNGEAQFRSPVGNVAHRNFDGISGPVDEGGSFLNWPLRNVDTNLPRRGPFLIENNFNDGSIASLSEQLGILQGSFSAIFTGALVGQAAVILVDGETFLFQAPAALDGGFGQAPTGSLLLLRESLDIEAWDELAEALEFTGGAILVMPDGPYAIDHSGRPDPAVSAELVEQLLVLAAQELTAALEVAVALPVTVMDGTTHIATVPEPIPPAVAQAMLDLLNDIAFGEMAAALDE